MVPSAGSARPQLKRGLMSSAVILRTVSSMGRLLVPSGFSPQGLLPKGLSIGCAGWRLGRTLYRQPRRGEAKPVTLRRFSAACIVYSAPGEKRHGAETEAGVRATGRND